jgi:ribosome-binding protein aMBF1 (putative translation factor)
MAKKMKKAGMPRGPGRPPKTSAKAKSGAASKIRKLRMDRGLTQAELADKAGLKQANVSAMESGNRTIGPKVATRLARALKCKPEHLLGR